MVVTGLFEWVSQESGGKVELETPKRRLDIFFCGEVLGGRIAVENVMRGLGTILPVHVLYLAIFANAIMAT